MATRSRSKGVLIGWKPCEPMPAIVLDFTNPVHVKLRVGGQTELAGTAPNQGEQARRLAAARLQPSRPQQPCDVGLFSDEVDQLDLCEMFRDTTEE